MPIPTEPIGSIPRPAGLLQALSGLAAGTTTRAAFEVAQEQAVRDTILAMEATGSPVVTDGEQAKPSFATYPIHGLSALAPDGERRSLERSRIRVSASSQISPPSW